MTKQCAWEDCNSEIQQWQTYCPTHYKDMTTKQGQTAKPVQAQPEQPVVQQPPELPPTSVPEPQKPAEPEMIDIIDEPEAKPEATPETKPVQPPKAISEAKPVEKPIETVQPTEKIAERVLMKGLKLTDKLDVRKTAFVGAITLMGGMEYEEKTFDNLMGEVETLTNLFSNIILTDYEQ